MTRPPSTPTPGAALLAAIEKAGVRLALDPRTGALTFDAPPSGLPDAIRAAITDHRDELEAELPMPAEGWPCRAGCGKQSLFTAERHRYRCWLCAYNQAAAAVAVGEKGGKE